MTTSTEQLRDTMAEKFDQLNEKVEQAKNEIKHVHAQHQAEVHEKLEQARMKLQEKQQHAAQAKSKLESDYKAKKAEWQGKVQDWKTQRAKDELEARAEDTEFFASAAFDVAVAAVYEADVAILEAIEAKQDADAAASI